MSNLTTEERIKRTQINLWRDKPFWAYLSHFLKFHEVKAEDMPMPTMCVDIEGNVYYCKEFINKLSDDELFGTIAHELGHLLYLTELRRGSKDKDGWNISTDLTINCLLKSDGFTLPKGVLVPDSNDEINCGHGKKIEKCSELIAEEIYDLLPKIIIDKDGNIYADDGKGNKTKIGRMIDGHIIGKGGKGKKGDKDGEGDIELSEADKREIEQKWKDRLLEAYTTAKMKGNVPAGIERLVGKIGEEKINWRTILQRYIMNSIPYNYTWQKPSRKSVVIGTYLPDVVKEQINIGVCVDVSGSIGNGELAEFLSEIIGVSKAFQERITMTIYFHETEINEKDIYVIDNGNIEKILAMKIHGGGGTSHIQPFKYIQENLKDSKCIIFLTDGYSDLNTINFDDYFFDKLFVISKNGNDSQLKGKNCEIIHLKEE